MLRVSPDHKLFIHGQISNGGFARCGEQCTAMAGRAGKDVTAPNRFRFCVTEAAAGTGTPDGKAQGGCSNNC